MAKRILIADDDTDLIRLLRFNLEKEGLSITAVSDGSLVLPEIRRSEPDALILDLMMPGMDGLEVCRQIRRTEKYGTLPILMLTARGEETDRVVGLEMGADDYVVKPFGMRELVARVRTLLRRRASSARYGAPVHQDSLTIDPSAHSVVVCGRNAELSALEFRLLYYLASNPGLVFSRDQILDQVWGDDRSVTPRSVDVYVRRIREKIETDPQSPVYIETVHGVGYRFACRPQDTL